MYVIFITNVTECTYCIHHTRIVAVT